MKLPELLITNGDLAGKRYAVGKGGLRLGRSSSNDIHVPDEELSRNHCLFEVENDSIRLTDLASANGTILNGKQLGGEPVMLKVGDVIEVGKTIIHVVGENEPTPAGSVDLGLGGDKKSPADSGEKKRSPLANVLWVVAVLVAVLAVVAVLIAPPAEREAAPVEVQEENPLLEEMSYEKVEANSEGIFRFELTLKDGVLSVAVDDVPKENRHLTKSERLNEQALAELNDILKLKTLREIDREYVGAEPDPPALQSWTLKAVYATRARTIRIANTQGPEAFRVIREKLEAFSKNQLGVWALQYSRDKLVELAEESIRLGKSKWEERQVQHGNLFESVAAYKEAMYYLETVNPKPECSVVAREGLKTASEELDKRYKDQRFLADRALNLRQWDVAQRELGVLLEMIPDRDDERHREAAAKLIDVEKRMKGDK